uniref:Uncharacterized protein n=1 Tax=Timema poppense TaxID=170557 RepID=A0A7R9DMQ2_TIMPO|nr:unnamed protein product [Timema poppensis]
MDHSMSPNMDHSMLQRPRTWRGAVCVTTGEPTSSSRTPSPPAVTSPPSPATRTTVSWREAASPAHRTATVATWATTPTGPTGEGPFTSSLETRNLFVPSLLEHLKMSLKPFLPGTARFPDNPHQILTTRDVTCSVFTAHQYHVRLEHSPRDEPLTSYGKIQLTLIGTNNINETFTLTQKDDEEIKSGGSLTRMLVPHPILQDPSSVEVTYTAYSGWISSGLPSWDVNKVTLTDSVGQSLSVCKKGLTLTSGVSVILPLYPGECNPPRTSGPAEDDWSTNQTATTTAGGPRKPTNVTRFTPTPIIRVGDEGLNRTDDLSGDVLEHPSWHPLDTNSLEDSRAFNSDIFTVVLGEGNLTADGGPHPLVDRSSGLSADEIKEPVLRQAVWAPVGKTSSSSVRRNGSRSEDPPRPEITEPVLNPKTLVPASITSTLKPSVVRTRHISDLSPPPEDAWSSWRSDATAEDPKLGPMQTVQLFPQRLASILAQAERYARTTLVQTPTGNSQNNTSTDGSSAQTLRRAKLMTTDGPDDVTVSPIIDARGVGGIVRTSQGSQVLVPYSYSSADSSSNQNTRFIPLSYHKDPSAPLSARQPSESTEGASKGKNEDSRFGWYVNIFSQLFSKIPPRRRESPRVDRDPKRRRDAQSDNCLTNMDTSLDRDYTISLVHGADRLETVVFHWTSDSYLRGTKAIMNRVVQPR